MWFMDTSEVQQWFYALQCILTVLLQCIKGAGLNAFKCVYNPAS